MHPYKNISGNSGVVAYELRGKAIAIQFADGGVYLYDYARPGRRAVEAMKALAARGEGLATYINQYVREKFACKLA